MNSLHWIFLAYTLGRIFLYWFPISFLLHTFLLPTSFLTLSCFFSPAFLLSSYFQCHIFSYLITFILYRLPSYYPPYSSLYFSFLFLPADYCGFAADMEKGADAQTLSAKKFEICGNFWIVENLFAYCGIKPYKFWKYLLKHQIFGIFSTYERWFPQYFNLLVEILINALAKNFNC